MFKMRNVFKFYNVLKVNSRPDSNYLKWAPLKQKDFLFQNFRGKLFDKTSINSLSRTEFGPYIQMRFKNSEAEKEMDSMNTFLDKDSLQKKYNDMLGEYGKRTENYRKAGQVYLKGSIENVKKLSGAPVLYLTIAGAISMPLVLPAAYMIFTFTYVPYGHYLLFAYSSSLLSFFAGNIFGHLSQGSNPLIGKANPIMQISAPLGLTTASLVLADPLNSFSCIAALMVASNVQTIYDKKNPWSFSIRQLICLVGSGSILLTMFGQLLFRTNDQKLKSLQNRLKKTDVESLMNNV